MARHPVILQTVGARSLVFLLCFTPVACGRVPERRQADTPATLLVGDGRDIRPVEEVNRPVRCDSVSYPLYVLSASIVPTACSLTRSSRETLIRGGGRHLGVGAKDSADFAGALVSRSIVRDTNGTVLERYSTVTISLRGRPYSVDVVWDDAK